MSLIPKKTTAFSVLELVCSSALFSMLMIISILSIRKIAGVWQKTSGRDQAMRELLRTDRFLSRDLANSAMAAQQSIVQPVQAGSGAVNTGDAIAMLLPGEQQVDLVITSGGVPILDRLVTYYLAVPQNVAGMTGLSYSYAPNASGYDDSCPYKWLVRKETTGPPAPDAYTLPSIPVGWMSSGVIEIPAQPWNQADKKVVAKNLHQFRVVSGPPTWVIEVTAVAVEDARRSLALGHVPLSSTRYSVTHRISVVANN